MCLAGMREAGMARRLNGVSVEMFVAHATPAELGFLLDRVRGKVVAIRVHLPSRAVSTLIQRIEYILQHGMQQLPSLVGVSKRRIAVYTIR